MAALTPGTAAPDFSLKSHTGSEHKLSERKGKKTVVAFLPFAFTGG
jgi:peroxiredoxin